jgi:hypothetical protein
MEAFKSPLGKARKNSQKRKCLPETFRIKKYWGKKIQQRDNLSKALFLSGYVL